MEPLSSRAVGEPPAPTPTLHLDNPRPETRPCPDCGELVGLGFEDGHRQFAHNIRPARRPTLPSGGGNRKPIVSFALFLAPAAATLTVVYLLAAWITADGRTFMIFHETTDSTRLALHLVVAAILVVPATPIFFAFVGMELAVGAALAFPFRAVAGARRRAAQPVKFNHLDAFACTARTSMLSALYTLRPKHGALLWTFRLDHEFEDFISDVLAIDAFATAAGAAIENALALPPHLWQFRADNRQPAPPQRPKAMRPPGHHSKIELEPEPPGAQSPNRTIVVGDELPASRVVAVAFPARLADDPDSMWSVLHAVSGQTGWCPAVRRSSDPYTSWTRSLDTSTGTLEVGENELIGLAFPTSAPDSAEYALTVLAHLEPDVLGFVKVPDGLPAEALARHHALVGLRLDTRSSDASPYEAIAGLPNLQWLSSASWHSPDAADLARLASMPRLRHLDILESKTWELVAGSDLAELERLSELRSLRIGFLTEADEWSPQLPDLRALAIELPRAQGDVYLPDLSRLASLDTLMTGWSGSVDDSLCDLEATMQLEHLRLGNMSVPVAGPAGIAALARMSGLTTLTFADGGFFAPNGCLQELAALSTLTFLHAKVDGATTADLEFLREHLPHAQLELQEADLAPFSRAR